MKTKYLLLFLLFSINLISQTNLDDSGFKAAINNIEAEGSFVLIGEAHEVAGTYETEAFIIQDLSKKGYNTFFYEGGNSEAFILNEYLETGDESVLNFTRAGGGNYKKFIKALKVVKESNPDFNIVGLDFERSICLEYVFKKWFANIQNPKLDPILKKLKKIKKKTSPKKVKEIILEVKSEFHLYEKELNAVLKEHTASLKAIIFNPVFQADFGLSSKKRDEAILENLLHKDIAQLKKSILIFGSNHFTNQKHFWPKFQEATKEKLDCLLILFAYKDCENYMRKKKYSSEKPLINYIQMDEAKTSKVSFHLEEDKEMRIVEKNNKLLIAKLIKQ